MTTRTFHEQTIYYANIMEKKLKRTYAMSFFLLKTRCCYLSLCYLTVRDWRKRKKSLCKKKYYLFTYSIKNEK